MTDTVRAVRAGGPVVPSRSLLRPLGSTELRVTGGFWAQWQELNASTILEHCESWMERIGWIGMGRMGYPMAELLLKAGLDVSIWNRTRAKAEPLAKAGGKIVDKLSDLASCDVVFSIVSTGKDLEEVYFGDHGVTHGRNSGLPKVFVDCSTIALEESSAIRAKLNALGAGYLACPVSGNGNSPNSTTATRASAGTFSPCRTDSRDSHSDTSAQPADTSSPLPAAIEPT